MDARQNGHGRQHQYQGSNHQRFSWQMPLNAPVEQGAPAPQQAPQLPQSQRRESARTQSQRNNRAFSYAQTPIEHRAFHYVPSPSEPPLPCSPPTPIDPRPQSIFTTQIPQAQTQPQPQPQTTYQQSSSHPSYPHDEKPPIPSSPPQDSTPPPLFSSVPLVTEPLPTHAQDTDIQKSNHSRQMSSLSRLNTNVGKYNMPPIPATPLTHITDPSPLPSKTPITPLSAKKETDNLLSPNRRMSYANTTPYSPHGFSNKTTSNSHAIFAPDSTHGPNGLDFSLHQPGQIAHPNMDLSAKGTTHGWKNSLCACSGDISTCLTGLFCPCILYGRTSYRLSQKSNKNDPTDLLGHSSTNGHCMLMGLSCVTGFHWLMPMIQRTRIRHAYKLSGSVVGDFAKSCCCCCCVTVQNEREVRDREESTRRWAGPASTDVYAKTSQMVYAPQ